MRWNKHHGVFRWDEPWGTTVEGTALKIRFKDAANLDHEEVVTMEKMRKHQKDEQGKGHHEPRFIVDQDCVSSLPNPRLERMKEREGLAKDH